jgi:Uma2 family endonuclease
MGKPAPHRWTFEEFLAFEAEEAERCELVDGVVHIMTGRSAGHSAIKGNVLALLQRELRAGPCRTHSSLKVVTETAVMHPDILVTCRPLAPDDDRVADPTVIVEVLSPTTEIHDRIRKWRQYQTIASLQHFVLIAQSERRIEVHTRAGGGWQLAVVEPPDDTVILKAADAHLSLQAIYAGSGRRGPPSQRVD